MKIEQFNPNHAAACLDLFESNTPHYFSPNERAEFKSFLDQPQCEFLVVSINEIVRACGGHYQRDGEGWLCWGMVHQDFHGMGLGKALLVERLRRLFLDQQVTKVSIHTSQYARSFFERFGFSCVGTPTPDGFGEGLDSVTMTLSRENYGKV